MSPPPPADFEEPQEEKILSMGCLLTVGQPEGTCDDDQSRHNLSYTTSSKRCTCLTIICLVRAPIYRPCSCLLTDISNNRSFDESIIKKWTIEPASLFESIQSSDPQYLWPEKEPEAIPTKASPALPENL